MWKRERETCFVWLNVHGLRVSRRERAGGWLRWATGGGRGGIFHIWGVRGSTGRRCRAGRAVPATCRVVFGAVGATSEGGDAAVEDWFEISTPGAGWVEAAMLCFGMGASTEVAYDRILTAGFDMTESPAVIVMLGGG